MSDEELPDDSDAPESDETPDLPPPSTFAGKARQADEQEEPPDEFAFDEDEDEDPNAGSGSDATETGEPDADKVPDPSGDAGKEPQAEPDKPDPGSAPDPSGDADEPPVDDTAVVPPPQVSSATVEADTLTLADVEAQREAAHAGIAARAKNSSFSHDVTTGSHRVQPPSAAPPAPAAAAAAPDEDDDDGVGQPPKRRIGWRFTAAAFVIVSSMAAATAVSFLLFLNDIAKGLNDSGLSAARAQLEEVEGGAPQTILILGSDKRETTEGDPGRSDTAILLRVDPDKEFLSLLSLPRDLYVPIPGYGEEKLNAAYTLGEQANPDGGGEELAIRTITGYLNTPINHVVNVDFGGFLEAVNAIGCVYVDVDRHYFNPTGGEYAEIDVKAGYQRLCGYQALQYVRYRHTDNDLVRGARQQDFIREARQRVPPRELLPVLGGGDELIDIFTKNTSSDIDNVSTIIGMMKSFVDVRNAPVRQVQLGRLNTAGGVEASPADVDAAVSQFLGQDVEEGEQQAEPAEPKEQEGGGGDENKEEPKPDQSSAPASLVDFAAPAQEKAAEFAQFMKHRKADLPIFYPTRLVQSDITGISDESRAALLLGPDGKTRYYMYKYVLPYAESFGPGYYGVSGTNWLDPPILENPSGTRTIDGREYLLFYEQDKLRLVGWRTSKGAYWVINTLTHALTEAQMLELAASTRELGG